MRARLPCLVLTLFASCSPAVTFDVTQTGEALAARGTFLQCKLAALDIGQFSDIQFDDTQEFENQGVEREDVESVHLTDLKMRVKSPEGKDMSYLSRVTFFAEADGVERVQVGDQTSFPAGAGTVSFTLSGAELKPYVVAPSMRITTEVSADGCPSEDQTLEITAVFQFEATARGITKYLRTQGG
jgi:hypothetical protein